MFARAPARPHRTAMGPALEQSKSSAEPPGPAVITAARRPTVPVALSAERPRSAFRRGTEVFAENTLAVAGLVIFAAVVLFCFGGPLVYHTDQVHVNLAIADLSPRAGHPLGTDPNGYDVLGRLMVAGQISLEVGIAAAVIATIVGVLWGAIAGYLGGIIDALMMRVVDALLAIPVLFLALVVVAIVTPSEPVLILVIALTSWLGTARLVRAEALSLRVREYVQAMRVMGGGGLRAVLRHVTPNAIGTIMVSAAFEVANAIALVVALSYLGVGVRPPQQDWGGMLSYGVQYVYDGVLVADLPGRVRGRPGHHRGDVGR